jgi:dTDP-4-amino-4,6-dideoxygalactose transaminase
MIPFNRPFLTGRELTYIAEAHANGHLAGNGPFSQRCAGWLEERLGSRRALLTHSCTAALEMAAILSGVGPGDEIVLPSFTFVSTANAFVLRGATPVFVDIRPDTLNLDERLLDAAITPRTRAIVPVHYAGVGCDMAAIDDIARRNDLLVIEDAAQGLLASHEGRPLGTFGQMAALSFHETKNIISGEGGALLLNDPRFVERAEIIWEKGTNRSQFFRGAVDKYTWIDLGSSYLPGEITAAFLWAQMEMADAITERRVAIWRRYHAAFAELEVEGLVRRPVTPDDAGANGHCYFLLLPDLEARTAVIDHLRARGIQAVFHYVPLHSAPFGRVAGRVSGTMAVTDDVSNRLVRLPLWLGLEAQLDAVIVEIIAAVRAVAHQAVDRHVGR